MEEIKKTIDEFAIKYTALDSNEYKWQYQYRMVTFELILKYLVDNKKALGNYDIASIVNDSSKKTEATLININKVISSNSCSFIIEPETKELLDYFENAFK